MNKDIFDFKRFWLFFSSEVKRCFSKCGLTLLVYGSLELFLYLFLLITGLAFGDLSGVDLGWREGTLFLSLLWFCTGITVKCYGHVTDKRDGTAFLMTPVSSFEKTASMVVVECIVLFIPFLMYCFGIDYLLCIVDKSNGIPVISAFGKDGVGWGNLFAVIKSPFILLDDVWQIILISLLGAVYFKKSKTAKTVGGYFGLALFLGLMLSPYLPSRPAGRILEYIPLIDTVSDTVINLALVTALFFRIKTLKH